jgi:hypothetical protein
VPSSWDFHVPSSFAINSSENSPGRGEGKKKKRKEKREERFGLLFEVFFSFSSPE